MLEKILWNLFLVTGDVDAYLNYKELEKDHGKDEKEDLKDICS